MDYSRATFNITGNFVVNSKDTTDRSKPDTQTKPQNRKRQTTQRRPKDLPKLCRWQHKCTRTQCAYVHLPPEIIASARKPYRLCWAHPKCKSGKCPFIHFTVKAKDDSLPAQTKEQVKSQTAATSVPSHLPQHWVRITRRLPSVSDEDYDEEDLRHEINRRTKS